MMTLYAISHSPDLRDDDRGIMVGEAVEPWCKAVVGT